MDFKNASAAFVDLSWTWPVLLLIIHEGTEAVEVAADGADNVAEVAEDVVVVAEDVVVEDIVVVVEIRKV